MKAVQEIDGQRFTNHLLRRWDYRELRRARHHVVLETHVPSHHVVAYVIDKVFLAHTLAALAAKVAAHKQINIELLLDRL